MTVSETRVQGLDLGVIGNCVLGALIDRQARYVWCCYPRLDSDPVFCSLLAGERQSELGGFMDVELDGHVSSQQEYLANSAILSTVLADAEGGSIRLIDFAPRFKQYERIFRPQMLVRRIVPLEGECRIRVRIRPRFEYGAITPNVAVGSNHIRYFSERSAIRVTTDVPVSYIDEERWFVLDSPITLILGADKPVSSSVSRLGESYLTRTEKYWVEWARYLSVPFEWQDAVIRAAITLKLCSFEETGGIVAAMTTSIPEGPGTGRNWDYRYCWLRDAYFVVHALNRLGATLTMEYFIRYITNIVGLEKDGHLKPVYSIVPGTPAPERIASSLEGYRSMGPVRVGNLAETQLQNDSYGSVVLAAAQMFFDRRLPQPGGTALYRRLEPLAERALEVAFAPDAGLWEFRDRSRVHTHSSVMCWAACDRLAKIAETLGLGERASHWRRAADRLRETILERAWNAQLNSFVDSFEGEDVDASLLLLPEVGFISPSDPRFLATLHTVERRLRSGYHLFRYRREDGLGVPVTAFTICTFWYVDALAAVGRREEAREIFEHLLSCRNHLGILSEDIDPQSETLWGNFPQTYSMVGLIVSAMRLSKSWEESFWRGS
jgi:GH15 family glucan-1,4-alpha-glucosidase